MSLKKGSFAPLPPEVDFRRFEGDKGEAVYVFNHAALGPVGCLSVIPYDNKPHLIWEPIGDCLQAYMLGLIEEIENILKADIDCYAIPCSQCGMTIARLLYFPGIQDIELLKACAYHHSHKFGSFYLPTWIIGDGIALEILWPIRKIFRAISLDELTTSLLAFESGHCIPRKLH